MWEVVQDSDYDSPAEAMSYLPAQYREIPARWVKYEGTARADPETATDISG